MVLQVFVHKLLCEYMFLILLGNNPEGTAGSYGDSFFVELSNCFLEELHHFMLPSAMDEDSNYSQNTILLIEIKLWSEI